MDFYRNNEKHGQGTQCAKMVTDSLAKNTSNIPHNLSAQFVFPGLKVLDFNEKRRPQSMIPGFCSLVFIIWDRKAKSNMILTHCSLPAPCWRVG